MRRPPDAADLVVLIGSQRDSLNDERSNAVVASTQGSVDIASAASVDWGYTAWALTHMLMFNKAYVPTFSALVQAVAGGKDAGTAPTLHLSD